MQCCLLQVIEQQPCQVPLDDALRFGQNFDPSHRLPEETNYPEPPDQAGRQAAIVRKQDAGQARKKERLKQKGKKKKRKRRN